MGGQYERQYYDSALPQRHMAAPLDVSTSDQ
jgi:hypothetical protein